MRTSSNIYQDLSFRDELRRKFLHVVALIIPLCITFLGKIPSLWILIPLSSVALFFEIARVRSEKAASFIYYFFGSIMRESEKPEIGSPVVINGATWVVLSATILTIIFPVHIACASLAMFMLGDAAAALVGKKMGRIQWPRSKKTLEGSFSFLVISGLTLFLFGILNWYHTLLIAFIATLLEVIPIPINDNVRVPILVATVIFILLQSLGTPGLHLFL